MTIMKKTIIYLAVFSLLLLFTGCQKEKSTGVLKLSLTDSPIDTRTISGVYITITDIEVNTPDGWQPLDSFAGPKTYNLLDLQRGKSDILGGIVLTGGNYSQIRFMLDAPEKGDESQSNPGCYISFNNGNEEPLFVPSGAQSGYKGVGEFTVPVNDTVKITADFDVRKSVVKAGNSGKYILKPVIRLVVENQAGSIRGDVSNIPQDSLLVIYAYADGVYKDEEAANPAGEASRFPNAVSSDRVDNLGFYHISFLAEGIYDLIVTSQAAGNFGEVLGIIENISVESNRTTIHNIDIDSL